MPTSLFIEQHTDGLAFYINGDLQFDTADEAIYHEYLVVPAIALAIQRFPNTQLRVLICGGGDGLAVRDALRFAEVSEITLVDYNPDVLELGRTVFTPYNQGSLLANPHEPLGKNRVAVHTQEAFEFITALPANCYHVVICDFTFPTCAEETHIYSWDWFQQVRRVLCSGGVMSTNGVSPEQRTLGFWCLYQTLLAAGLAAKPLQVAIPSFHRHGYGDWGFLLGSDTPIARSEMDKLILPADLKALQSPSWQQAFQVPAPIAQLRQFAQIHTLACPQLFYYLLNPKIQPEVTSLPASEACLTVDFLEIQDAPIALVETASALQLDAIAQVWLQQLRQLRMSDRSELNLEQLIPVQHRYHSPTMNQEWFGYLKHLLNEIDLQQLLTCLLERAQELPPQVVRELRQLIEKVRASQPVTYISEHTAELITILAVTLIMANLSTPDAVFAKGYSSGGRSSYVSGGSSSGGDSGDFGVVGFFMFFGGIMWLSSLYGNKNNH